MKGATTMLKTTFGHTLIIGMLAGGAQHVAGQTGPGGGQLSENELIAVLESDASQKEKVDACRNLAVIGTKAAVPALAALLDDEKLSHMARYGLEPIPDPAVDQALRTALNHLKGRPLVGVIASIGVRRDAKATEALAKLLENPDTQVAHAAARALGRIGNSAAAQLLSDLLAKAPAVDRPAVADACLTCAERLLAEGKQSRAAEVYQLVAAADLPKHFRIAAARGVILSQPPQDK
jgi:HEAT repeat protein